MKQFLLAAATFSLLSSTALAQMAPQAFVERSAASSAFEIQSSQMILDAGDADADVREFAEDMIADHTKATEDLKTAASASGLTVPEALEPKQETMLEQLESADNKAELYIQQQVSAHNEAVVLHESYAADGEDANLKTFAQAQTPILREHLGHVQGLNSSADAGMASGMSMDSGSEATGSTTGDETRGTEATPSSATTGPVTSGTVTTGGQGTGSGTSGSSGTIDAGEGNSGGVAPQQ